MSNAKWAGFARSNLIVAALFVLVIAFSIWLAQWGSSTQSEPIVLIDGPLIVSPPVAPSGKVQVPDDCPIIGVTYNGKSRAYVVSAFFRSHQHVINDLIGGKPFTITYCDRTNCTNVFTSHDSRLPLNVTVGGWAGTEVLGTLLIRVGSKLYRQDTLKALSSGEEMPYASVAFERTTWKEWLSKHPDSDAYLQFPKDRGVMNH